LGEPANRQTHPIAQTPGSGLKSRQPCVSTERLGGMAMASRLIKLEDGTLIEIDQPTAEVEEISGGGLDAIRDATIDKIRPILERAIRPIAEVYKELNKDMEVREAEVELGLGFEAEGNLYITKAKGNANLVIKLKLAPKPS
jgi:hypothetical protein